MKTVMSLLFALAFGSSLFAAEPFSSPDVTIPLIGGRIVLSRIQFLELSGSPMLSLMIANGTTEPVWQLTFSYTIEGKHDGKACKWSHESSTRPAFSIYPDRTAPLIVSVDDEMLGCAADHVAISLVEAQSFKWLVDGKTGKQTDLVAKAAAEAAKAAAVAAAEQARREANCHNIYSHTADKKMADLTVKEEELVRACQALGLYRGE